MDTDITMLNDRINELQKEREALLDNPEIANLVEAFRNRGRYFSQDTPENRRLLAEDNENRQGFRDRFSNIETLDVSNPQLVFEWLKSLEPFINDPELSLPLGLANIEYNNAANYIVVKLAEKGYTDVLPKEIQNENDYYRTLIAHQISDLANYGFFAYDYLKEEKVQTMNDVKNAYEELLNMSREALNTNPKLFVKKMKVDTKAVEETTRQVGSILKELKTTKAPSKDQESLMAEYEQAQKSFESINDFYQNLTVGKDAEQVLPFYNKALETHDKEDILKALIAAERLLEKGNPYISAIQNTLKTMVPVYYPEETLESIVEDKRNSQKASKDQEQIQKNFEDAQKHFETTNDFYQNLAAGKDAEQVLPYYQKALETHDKEDILRALIAAERLLEKGNPYISAIQNSLKAMVPVYYKEETLESIIEERKTKQKTANDNEQAQVNFENAKKYFESTNNFYQNLAAGKDAEQVLPFYNKALETHDKEDILRALAATERLLERGNPYIGAIQNTLKAMVPVYYPEETLESIVEEVRENQRKEKVQQENKKNFEEAKKRFDTTNSFYQNLTVGKEAEPVIPYYKKALETHNKVDILKALKAAETNLPKGNPYIETIQNSLKTMVPVYYPGESLETVVQEYAKNPEQQKRNQKIQEIESLLKQAKMFDITNQPKLIDNMKNTLNNALTQNGSLYTEDEKKLLENFVNSFDAYSKEKQNPKTTGTIDLDKLDQEMQELMSQNAPSDAIKKKLSEILVPLTAVKELEKKKLTQEIKKLENKLNDEKLTPEERQQLEEELATKKQMLDKVHQELEEKNNKLENLVDAYEKANPKALEDKKNQQQSIDNQENEIPALPGELEDGTPVKAVEEIPALPGELEDGTPVKAVEEVPALPGALADGTPIRSTDVILDPNEDSPILENVEINTTTPSNPKLRNKLKDIKQKGFLGKALDFMKEHKVAFIVGTVVIGLAATLGITALVAALKPNEKAGNDNQPSVSTEQEFTNPDETPAPIIQEDTKDESNENVVVQAPTAEEIFNQVMADEQERIASGEEAIYRDIYSAAENENALYAKSDHIQNIWQQTDVEANKYYQVTETGLEEIQAGDDVINAIAEGKSVVTTWANEDGTLGRSVISTNDMMQAQDSLENESAKTM